MNLVMSQFMMGAPSLLQRDLHPQSFAMPPSTLDARGCALDATSTDPWGPSQFLMEELHVYTQTKHCADVLHVLHDALTSRGPQWRRVLKVGTYSPPPLNSHRITAYVLKLTIFSSFACI